MRAALESLLRSRKLDVTLTTAAPWAETPPERLAPTGCADLDTALGGGLRRGHLSEITGAASSGRSTLVMRAIAAATARGEMAALVDTCDTFDPPSAAACGVDLASLLWVRETGDAVRALKAFSLILQAGGFGVVVFDLADVAPSALRQFPYTTWMRVARTIDGSETVALLVGSDRLARSPGGVTIALPSTPPRWAGRVHRARLFAGVMPAPRVVSAR
jgi:recombination protein RecA